MVEHFSRFTLHFTLDACHANTINPGHMCFLEFHQQFPKAEVRIHERPPRLHPEEGLEQRAPVMVHEIRSHDSRASAHALGAVDVHSAVPFVARVEQLKDGRKGGLEERSAAVVGAVIQGDVEDGGALAEGAV